MDSEGDRHRELTSINLIIPSSRESFHFFLTMISYNFVMISILKNQRVMIFILFLFFSSEQHIQASEKKLITVKQFNS